MNILLCCGAGMSSGFLAQRARQAAKKRKMSISIDARSESEVAGYLKQTNVLLIGPHYGNRINDFKRMAEPYGIPVIVIPKDIYASLNGDALLDVVFDVIEEKI